MVGSPWYAKPALPMTFHLPKHGAPVHLRMPNWNSSQVLDAILRGPHQSAHLYQDFLFEEMGAMVAKGQWLVLPYEAVQHLPNLWVSPIGVVPQHDHYPQTIVDYSYYFLNAETLDLSAPEAIQFGRTLQCCLQAIMEADPRHGPVHMLKVDVSDGFYCIHVHPADIPALSVAFPSLDGTPLVAFPLTLPMGWVNSPPLFCAAMEMASDLANLALQSQLPQLPKHCLDDCADSPDTTLPFSLSGEEIHSTCPPCHKPPIAYNDVYVDDFITLAQGTPHRQHQVCRNLFQCINQVFHPLSPNNPSSCQEPILVKKLLKGEGC